MKWSFPTLVIAFLLFLNLGLGSWVGWTMLRENEDDSVATTFSQSETACNAVWAGHSWIEFEQTEEDIQTFANTLRENDVSCVYLHATPLNDDGSFDLSRGQYTRSFLTSFRQYYPEATLYAWIGMVTVDNDANTIGYKFDLNEDDRMLRVQQTLFELVDDYGFDGIHLNMEPVENDSQAFLTFLSGLHTGLLDRGKPLSAALIFIADERRIQLWTEEGKKFLWGWLPEYYDRVAYYLDQMVIMHYEFGLTDPDEFADRVVWHAEELQSVRESGTHLIIGLPSYDFRFSAGENIESGLWGIQRAREQGFDFDGIALYAHWETDESEWQTWRENK